jgi:hypothetical protein
MRQSFAKFSSIFHNVLIPRDITHPHKRVWYLMLEAQFETVLAQGHFPKTPLLYQAYDFSAVPAAATKLYNGASVIAVPISIAQVQRKGFKILYETDGVSDVRHWYLEPQVSDLLTIDCME